MIGALAKAGGVLGNLSYIEAAEKAAELVLDRMRKNDGALLHRFRAGEAAIAGFATDYAYVIWGLIELYEATFKSGYLSQAIELMDRFIRDFWDEEGAGFFITADDAENLLVRQRSQVDGALPGAGSVALIGLLKLGRMTQNDDYQKRAVAIIRASSRMLESSPLALAYMLTAFDFYIGPSYEVVITGATRDSETDSVAQALRSVFVPNKVTLFRPTNEQNPGILELSPFLAYQTAIGGKTTIYVCENYACELPVTTAAEMLNLLRAAPLQLD